MSPRWRLPFFTATPSSWFRTLEWLFKMTHCISRALNLNTLLRELQRYKDTVRCGALGTEVPGHRRKQLTLRRLRLLAKHLLFLYIRKWVRGGVLASLSDSLNEGFISRTLKHFFGGFKICDIYLLKRRFRQLKEGRQLKPWLRQECKFASC